MALYAQGNGRREFLQVLGSGVLGLMAGRAAMAKPMRGVFPIGQTPFTEDDKLDLECLAAEVRFCNRGGVHGFAWPQIASGWSTLSARERLDGAEAILAAGKGGKTALVIGVQTQGADLAGSVRYGTTPSQITSAGSRTEKPFATRRSIGSSFSKLQLT